MRRSTVLCATAVAAQLLVPGLAVAAPAAQPVLPDFAVSKGHVKLKTASVSGSFTIKDKGTAAAPASSAEVSIEADSTWHSVEVTSVPALGKGKSKTMAFSVVLPTGLSTGKYAVRACADNTAEVTESSETNNCRTLGKVSFHAPSTKPTAPVTYQAGVELHETGSADYWVDVPASYNVKTPSAVLVWLHGCGETSSGDVYTVSPNDTSQRWISMAVGGREGDCWDPATDQPKVLAALTDLETHFNVDRRKVVIGGYSSGGDLAYRTAFYHSDTFAGLLAENTSPFMDTGSTQAQSLAAAAWKFHVAHLAHLQDTVYPITGVRTETDAMTAAGFPVTRIERDGGHSDGTTLPDLRNVLLPYLGHGWLAPTWPGAGR